MSFVSRLPQYLRVDHGSVCFSSRATDRLTQKTAYFMHAMFTGAVAVAWWIDMAYSLGVAFKKERGAQLIREMNWGFN